MNNRKTGYFVLFIIVFSFAIGIFLYPRLPEILPSHWNTSGEVDGYMHKFWGLFLLPIISAFSFILLKLLPKLDPLKENYKEFEKYYNFFLAIFVIFLFYLYLLSVYWFLGFRFNMIQLLSPAFGVLFYYIGVLMEKSKRNWFVGIRTPWTLSNDKVWSKTNKLGGKLFRLGGILAFLGLIFPNVEIFVLLFMAIAFTLAIFIYSYVEYRKELDRR